MKEQDLIDLGFTKRVQESEIFIQDNYHFYEMVFTDDSSLIKALHKEEIIKSMSFAFIDGAKIGAINYESPFTDWEQYYNETFGGNK